MQVEDPSNRTNDNEQIEGRKLKLANLRKEANPFPNDFRRSHLAGDLHKTYGEQSDEALNQQAIHLSVAGRIMTRRLMGKAAFIHVQDGSGRIQIYIRQEGLKDGLFDAFQGWDLGDIVGVEGVLFKTKTGELSIKASGLRLLTKALRPLPDKWHGLSDHEIRYRQRYLDLIVNEKSRETFRIRAAVIERIRHFLITRDFLEVETSMMHPIPGGAIAKPFVTHHNALGMDLYLRVSPELYLKRLVVGGFEKVFEINRNFRNEGLSTRHNPEFTMLEFYQAYVDYHDLMDLSEVLFRDVVQFVCGALIIQYQGLTLDFQKPFDRLTIKEALLKYVPGLERAAVEAMSGSAQFALFEAQVESQLQQPTFITEHPIEVSPLARANDQNPNVADRAEFYIAGREIANLFSELNDPVDQAERFKAQVRAKESGDEEAMYYDADYIVALEHGLPPTAGEGIGIDRLVMLLSDSPSIRDVLLFPQMRPE